MFDLCKDRKELTRVKGRDTTDRSSSTDLCVAKFKKCICVKLSSQQQIAKRHVCAVYIMYFTVVIPRTMFVQYVACNHKMHNGTTFLNAAFSLNSPSRELQPARRRRRSRSRRLVRFATVSNTSVTSRQLCVTDRTRRDAMCCICRTPVQHLWNERNKEHRQVATVARRGRETADLRCRCTEKTFLVHLLETVSPNMPQNSSAGQWSFCRHVRNHDLPMLPQNQPIRWIRLICQRSRSRRPKASTHCGATAKPPASHSVSSPCSSKDKEAIVSCQNTTPSVATIIAKPL